MIARTVAAALVFTALAGHSVALADFDAPAVVEAGSAAQDRLLIVNGNSGKVIYDDGRSDLFCVTRTVVSGYDWYGRPYYKRTMKCR